MLSKTGLFEPQMTYTTGTTLYTGDILVTKTSGHTVIVVKGKARKKTKLRAAKPVLRKDDTGAEVEMLQRDLNKLGFSGKDRKRLEVDGDFGTNTDYALRNFQKTHNYTEDEPLEVDGIYGKKSYSAMKTALKG
jgi:peptidoglycan hydrolase-like protein with peptidoglycan-binding domain